MVNPNRYHDEVGRRTTFGILTLVVDSTGLKTGAIDYTGIFSGTPRLWYQVVVQGATPARFDSPTAVAPSNTGATLALNVTTAGNPLDEAELHWFAAGNKAT